jgi:hypothetical protein
LNPVDVFPDEPAYIHNKTLDLGKLETLQANIPGTNIVQFNDVWDMLDLPQLKNKPIACTACGATGFFDADFIQNSVMCQSCGRSGKFTQFVAEMVYQASISKNKKVKK